MRLRFLSFGLAAALAACDERSAEESMPANVPAPTLVNLQAEIHAAESTNAQKLAAAAESLQSLFEQKAQAVHEHRTEDVPGIDQAGAAKLKEVQALEAARRELESQMAELTQEETEATKIAEVGEEGDVLATPQPPALEAAQALRLSSPLLLPKLDEPVALAHAQILRRDAETMLVVTVADRGLRIVQIKMTDAELKPSQTVVRVPLNLAEDSAEAMNLRIARVTPQGGLDVLLLNDTRLELIRFDANYRVKNRSVYRHPTYDAKLGYTAVFTPKGAVVWTSGGLLMKSDFKMRRPTICRLPRRSGNIGNGENIDRAVQIYETETRGVYLAVAYSDLGFMPAIESALRISFEAPKTAQNPCGMRVLAESKNPFRIAGVINQNLGNYFFAHGPQRPGIGIGAIQRPSAEGMGNSHTPKLYANAFVAAGRVAGVSALRDEKQIDILGTELKVQASYRHAAKIYDAAAVSPKSDDMLVVDSQGTLTLVDVAALLAGSANAVRETRRLSDETFAIRILDIRLGEKRDIVPFAIGHNYDNRHFDQFGFIRVMPAR